jgi:hypothetical protein
VAISILGSNPARALKAAYAGECGDQEYACADIIFRSLYANRSATALLRLSTETTPDGVLNIFSNTGTKSVAPGGFTRFQFNVGGTFTGLDFNLLGIILACASRLRYAL